MSRFGRSCPAELAQQHRASSDQALLADTTGSVAGLPDRSHAAPREQIPARIRARVLALTRTGGAVVPSFDEKTQIQAFDHAQPPLPIDCGLAEKRTHDYQRHGTTNLFAASNTTTGEVFAQSPSPPAGCGSPRGQPSAEC